MDYLTLRPLTKLSQNQRTSQRNNFAEHDYKYVFRSKTTKPSSTKTQSYLFSQSQIKQQPASNSVNLNDHPQTSADRSKIIRFFNKTKITQIHVSLEINIPTIQLIIFHHMIKIIIIKFFHDFIQAKDLVLTA